MLEPPFDREAKQRRGEAVERRSRGEAEERRSRGEAKQRRGEAEERRSRGEAKQRKGEAENIQSGLKRGVPFVRAPKLGFDCVRSGLERMSGALGRGSQKMFSQHIICSYM